MTDGARLKPPVLVVGGTRSGTTMLGNVLGSLPGMVYWHEPNTLWRTGHAYRRHDRAHPRDARPWVKRRIRDAMLRFQEEHGGRIVEKSPYNPARLAYVHELLPEAKIVHIHRDGRAMLRSQIEKLETFKPYNLGNAQTYRYMRRRLGMTPWWEWPAYLPRFTGAIFRRHVLKQKTRWFGLRYEGWHRDIARGMSRIEIVAKQWQHAIDYAFEDMQTLPEGVCLSLRYEDVAADPVPMLREICSFCDIEASDADLEKSAMPIHRSSVDRWKHELDAETIERATELMAPTLTRLGYELEVTASVPA